MVSESDLYCPQCGKLGYEGGHGWVMHCRSCDHPGWGHPQINSRQDYRDALWVLRNRTAAVRGEAREGK